MSLTLDLGLIIVKDVFGGRQTDFCDRLMVVGTVFAYWMAAMSLKFQGKIKPTAFHFGVSA